MTMTLIIAIVLLPAWAYLVGVAVAAVRFARHPLPTAAEPRPVTVMMPLHGAEPGLYENLHSFARQDYPLLQLVLGVGNAKDSALPAARALIRDLPESDEITVYKSLGHIVQGVGDGELPAGDATELGRLVGIVSQVARETDHELRIAKLEASAVEVKAK